MKRFGITRSLILAIGFVAFAACLAISDFALAADVINPVTHAGALALAHPFADAGTTLSMAGAAFGTYDYWHPIRKTHAHPAQTLPIVISATSADCPDGILQIDPTTGFAKLYAFENLRSQCVASNDPAAQQCAKDLPEFFAFDPVVDKDSLSDEAKFNVVTNCAKAQTLSGRTIAWTDPTMNTPDPSGKERWIEGDAIPNAWALPTQVTLNDLPALAQQILQSYTLKHA